MREIIGKRVLLGERSFPEMVLQKVIQRHGKDLFHFDSVWFQLHILGKQGDKGNDQFISVALLLRKPSQLVGPVARHTQLLLQFPQGRLPGALPRFHPSAGKTHLPGTATQMPSTKLQHDFHALPPPDEGYNDCGAEKRTVQISPC